MDRACRATLCADIGVFKSGYSPVLQRLKCVKCTKYAILTVLWTFDYNIRYTSVHLNSWLNILDDLAWNAKFRPQRDGRPSWKPSKSDISACERDRDDSWFYRPIFEVKDSNEAIAAWKFYHIHFNYQYGWKRVDIEYLGLRANRGTIFGSISTLSTPTNPIKPTYWKDYDVWKFM
jgi:hypothetical protein